MIFTIRTRGKNTVISSFQKLEFFFKKANNSGFGAILCGSLYFSKIAC
ncbi:hypothetical protein LEP1GSC125_1081 [Leptospira mayottensis 200901122]|uniref:Uncharacterized protein n=1 Tax=Leptospira mayottensis 200901122 TaxID=1193010 RepID=A0AA87SXF3_9LEPT|nr:hypothetical protein LEP1GSC125_1081 [Leptospira mayottensis 200901122]